MSSADLKTVVEKYDRKLTKAISKLGPTTNGAALHVALSAHLHRLELHVAKSVGPMAKLELRQLSEQATGISWGASEMKPSPSVVLTGEGGSR